MSLEIWKDGDTVNVRDVDGLVQLIENGGGGDALTTNPLSQFAATTSSQLAGVISDETGSGALVFATSPTLVTPILGTPTSGNLANCTGYAYGSLTGVPSTFPPSSHTHAASAIDSGTLDIARIPTGTSSSTVCIGNDGRLSDARTPTAHTHPLSQIEQSSATTGQVATWNGTAWAPATVSGGLGDIAANSIVGNNTGSTAPAIALTSSQVRTLLGLATTESPTFAGATFGSTSTATFSTGGLLTFSGGGTSDQLVRFGNGYLRRDGTCAAVNFAIEAAPALFISASTFRLGFSANFGFTSNSGISNSIDAGWFRDAANTIHQRNGTNGQIARWAKTWTSATNNELIELDCAGNATTFDVAVCSGSAGGTNRGLRFGQKFAGGAFTPWLSFSTNGVVTFTANAIYVPPLSVTLDTNGQFTFERVSDTEINLVYRGNDGTTRRALITLS